jgi:hypothetical protein
MAVRIIETRYCDMCEADFSDRPDWMILSAPNAPEDTDAQFDFCSYDCLVAWINTDEEDRPAAPAEDLKQNEVAVRRPGCPAPASDDDAGRRHRLRLLQPASSVKISDAARETVHRRSGGRCEVMVEYERIHGRCTRPAQEVHHLLTRGRGGGALDQVGETYHLSDLCREHHRLADGAAAYESGLLIDGYCIYDRLLGRPVYTALTRT